MHRRLLPIFASYVLFAALPAGAEEWTRFRGPNGSGFSEATTIPTEWTDENYNWKIELPGIGHSSPVVWGNQVFVTCGNPQTGARIAICIDASNGNTLWRREFPAANNPVHAQNSLASSSPAVDRSHVYLTWMTPEEYVLLALDHGGTEIWRINLGPFQTEFGGGTSPIVYQDRVVLGNEQDGESFLLAVDCMSGSTRWKSPRKTKITACSTPCVYLPTDGAPELIFSSTAHGLSSIDPATGQVNWELPVFDNRAVGSPLIVDDLIICACGVGTGKITLFAIRPGKRDGRRPEVIYTLDQATAPYVPTPIAHGHLLFLWSDRGIVSCLDAPTGNVHWRERVGGDYSGSPVRVGDHLYCISTEGEVVVLAAMREFRLISRQPLGETSRATPAISDGCMYLRTISHLYSLGGNHELTAAKVE